MKRSGEWQVTSGKQWLGSELCCRKLKIKNSGSVLTDNLKLRTYNSLLAAHVCVIILVAAAFGGCGYHVAGKSDALPKNIHVIAVPALENKTTSYRIEQRLTAATVHEFLAKTPYRVVSDPANGDAVLRGKVLSLEAVPLLFDTTTGRATTMLVTVRCEVTFEERDTGKALFHTDNFLFRNEYEISTDVKSFFEEQDPALDRLAQDFAARLVAAVTENF
jgi:outer membrane lipopolysaccharide assembly protein LptE/RlpB